MEILGNMQPLSSCSRVLTSGIRMGTVGVKEAKDTQYWRYAMLKLVFVAPKFRLRRVQKNGKKEQKMKNRVLQKTLFFHWEVVSAEFFRILYTGILTVKLSIMHDYHTIIIIKFTSVNLSACICKMEAFIGKFPYFLSLTTCMYI